MIINNKECLLVIENESNLALLYTILNMIKRHNITIFLLKEMIDFEAFNNFICYLVQTKNTKKLNIFVYNKDLKKYLDNEKLFFIKENTIYNIYSLNNLILQNYGYIDNFGYLIKNENKNIIVIKNDHINIYDSNLYFPTIKLI